MTYTFTCECGGDTDMKCAELEQGYPCLAEAERRPLLYTHWVRPHYRPAPMSKDALVELLEAVKAYVAAGDSFEGSLEYMMPDPEDHEANPDVWAMVRGSIRTGNSMGQGGISFIGLGPDQ